VTEVFADTFYWIALLNPNDYFHEAAIHTPVSGRIVTSLAVQLEVLDAFSVQPRLRPLAVRFWQRTRHNPDVTVVSLHDELLEQAMSLLQARSDKLWSITDCISFQIMRQRGISTALTGDRHFQQAGFEVLFETNDA
jgi:predicted nucleic acid-binding protein